VSGESGIGCCSSTSTGAMQEGRSVRRLRDIDQCLLTTASVS
jgi:hypothetical protein